MGGGEIIASFLDAHAIDEMVMSVVPVFIGDGILRNREASAPRDAAGSARCEPVRRRRGATALRGAGRRVMERELKRTSVSWTLEVNLVGETPTAAGGSAYWRVTMRSYIA